MTMYVNNSLLRLLAECETKAWIRWGQELVMTERDGPGPMEVGQALHVAFAAWMRGETTREVLACFEEGWGRYIGEELPREERLHPGNVRLVLEHFLLAQEGRVRDFDVIEGYTERAFEVPLGTVHGEEVIFYGTLDGLIDWKGGTWLLEHKTTGNMDQHWEAQWGMTAQLQGYVWALRQMGVQVKGAFVNGLEVRRLPPWDGNFQKKCGQHKVKYLECQGLHVKHTWVGPLWWSSERLAQWRRDVLAQVERLMWLREEWERASLENVMMDGQFRWPGCQRCQYKPWCQAGRPEGGLAQMMVHSPWKRDTSMEEVEG